MLLGAQQLAGAAQAHVLVGELEAVVLPLQEVQAGHGFVRGVIAGEQQAVALGAAAADAPSELVQLGQPEAFGALDQHHRGVGHVHPHLDHRRGHQHLAAAGAKVLHDRVLLHHATSLDGTGISGA